MESFHFDYYSITLLIGGFAALLSGLVVFIHNNKKQENGAWFLLNLSSAVWSFGYFLMTTSEEYGTALVSNWVLHGAAIFIPLCYFLCILTITKTFESQKTVFTGALITALLFLIVNPTKWFVETVIPKGPFNFAPEPGPLYIYFTLYFFALVIYSLVIVFKLYRTTQNPTEKQRFKYVLLFTLAGFGGGGSVFLLTFNIGIAPYPLILFALYPIISGYALFKYQLFEVKVVATQILTFGLWLFIFTRTLLADSIREQIINSTLLFATVIFGILLIRGVLQEVRSREHIETLAKDLEKINKELEQANNRLKELDQLKSEFVSLATHQIRGPLAAIKGYASLILEGDFGKVTKTLHDPIDKIFQSCQSLVVIVEDFLNISRIELGRMKYDFVDFNLSALVAETVAELQPSIEKSGLALRTDIKENVFVRADMGKIKQVMSNLIDNAIKYTPQGSISVRLTHEGQVARFSVTDTGIGIPAEVIPSLFQKFSRAKDASKTNIMGAGLGLYVAGEMIKAHHGRVWAESEGVGKGSTFFMELECCKAEFATPLSTIKSVDVLNS